MITNSTFKIMEDLSGPNLHPLTDNITLIVLLVQLTTQYAEKYLYMLATMLLDTKISNPINNKRNTINHLDIIAI